MKKKLLFPCLLLTAAMLFACIFTFSVSAATVTMTDVAGGATVASGDVVTISDEAELKAFSKYVSDGGATVGITFRLENDIALSDLGTYSGNTNYVTTLNPIGGVYNGASEAQAFRGTFDGNGKTISNLIISHKYVDGTGAKKGATGNKLDYCGLFAKIEGGTVKDLTIKLDHIKEIGSNGAYGVITGYATDATILNTMVIAEDAAATHLTVTKNTSTAIGGLVGSAKNSVIDGCSVNITVKGYKIVAGLVGSAENTAIRNCVVGGKYSNTQSSVLGGIVGELVGSSSVKNSYSSVTLTGKTKLGGVVGVVGEDATVENCFSDASVSTGGTLVSGVLVGENNGTVKHSFGLRAADKSVYDAHADIGADNGAAEDIYAYTVKTEGENTAFVVGTVTSKFEALNCWDVPHMGGTCTKDAPGCNACSGGVLNMWVYEFVATEDAAMANLADALNAWVSENADAAYVEWVVSGSTIVNCKHTNTAYVPYKGQEPNCVSAGHGDLVCSACGKVMEENAEIPATPDVHTSPDGKVYSCVAYDCFYCGTHVANTEDHKIDATKTCLDQTCSRCHNVIAAVDGHTRPDNFDASKPCAQYDCTVCGTNTHDEEHDAPAVVSPCQSSKCTVCGYVVQKGDASAHLPGLSPTCTRAQYCLNCREELLPARGHAWGEAANCGYAQTCTVCKEKNPDAPATGDHTPSGVYVKEKLLDEEGNVVYQEDGVTPVYVQKFVADKATCEDSVYCTVCGKVVDYKKGHTKESGSVDCGHGLNCVTCHKVMESSTGEHCVDWSDAKVIRPATPTRTGIVEVVCEDCGRVLEGFITYALNDNSGMASLTADGKTYYFYVGGSVDVKVLKAADYKDSSFAAGYLPVQAVAISVYDAQGNLAKNGPVTIKLRLNNSAVKMAAETLKVYAEDGTELTVISVEDGYITFAANGVGTFVIVAEQKAAFETIGTRVVGAEETAALIGTYLYEKKDDEI